MSGVKSQIMQNISDFHPEYEREQAEEEAQNELERLADRGVQEAIDELRGF